jgi:hypothetical protein
MTKYWQLNGLNALVVNILRIYYKSFILLSPVSFLTLCMHNIKIVSILLSTDLAYSMDTSQGW